ncbi:MAG: hypothetical protein DHS20C12_25080 [Pseudohongiella sp.]|nr:MAG: hypothetical protein DHS20C12_25080 [Pseudohongiella sp.]
MTAVARQTFYYSDGPYLQAMQGLHAALSGSEAFVKFIGQPRTGKSGVCEKLTQFMRLKDYRVIYFDYPIESPDMLRSMLAKELDIPDSYNMFRHLEDALETEGGKPLVIIFDDAHLLSDISLIEIYRLAGVQVGQKRVINIVLCGEPELERRLSRKKEFTSLLHHVSHNFLLEPMDSATASQFLSAYLSKQGLPGVSLEPPALSQFYKTCKGFPGPTVSLSQLVFDMVKDSEEQQPITKEELLRAIRASDSEHSVPGSRLREGNRWMLFAPLCAVVVIASLAFLFRLLDPAELETASEEPASLVSDDAQALDTVTTITSPFAADELSANSNEAPAESNGAEPSASSTDPALAAEFSTPTQAEPASQQQSVVEDSMPVSDSNLALVTAQERGISLETITEPLFEQMDSDATAAEPAPSPLDESAASNDVVDLENITLTRPMLALDDEETVVEAEPEAVIATADSQPVAEVALEQSVEAAESEAIALTPQQFVQAWLEAWEGQDLENYFASYDEDFEPRYHSSKAEWRRNRERVIGNASQITLELSDFVLISEDAQTIEVHFWLAYTSPSYRDDTRKKVILKKQAASAQGAAKLLILEEINLEVRV